MQLEALNLYSFSATLSFALRARLFSSTSFSCNFIPEPTSTPLPLLSTSRFQTTKNLILYDAWRHPLHVIRWQMLLLLQCLLHPSNWQTRWFILSNWRTLLIAIACFIKISPSQRLFRTPLQIWDSSCRCCISFVFPWAFFQVVLVDQHEIQEHSHCSENSKDSSSNNHQTNHQFIRLFHFTRLAPLSLAE